MFIDNIGERPVTDSGGFPVVWVGGDAPICQDPDQGGTNCYGPGDVLFDAETGAGYQITGDWHVVAMADPSAGDQLNGPGPDMSVVDPTQNWQPSPDSGPVDTGPQLTNHFFYVDTGEIVEKWEYSDGSAQFSDTGVPVNLPDGTAGPDIGSLLAAQAPPPGIPSAPPAFGGQPAPTPAPVATGGGNRNPPIVSPPISAPRRAPGQPLPTRAPSVVGGGTTTRAPVALGSRTPAPVAGTAGTLAAGTRAGTTGGTGGGTRQGLITTSTPSLSTFLTDPTKRLVPNVDNSMLLVGAGLGLLLLSSGKRRR